MSSRRLQTAIEKPTLELKIVSATDVGYIDDTDKIDVYAIVSLIGDTTQKKQTAKTPIDYDGGSNPTWNHTVKFSVDKDRASEGLLAVYVKLYSYWLEDENDIYLGEVKVSVQELLASNPIPPFANGNVNKMKLVTYPLKFIGETKPNAKLSLSYRFKPVPVNDDLYPPPPPAQDYSPPFGSQSAYTNTDPARSGQPIIYSPQFQTTGQTTTVTKLAIEVVIKSANDIRNVNVFDDMDVYASVMIRDGKTTITHKTKTPIAYSGFKFPTWNHAVKFSFDEKELAGDGEDRFTLVVDLMSHRPVLGDKHIGEVKVLIQELIGSNPPSPLTDVNASGMKLVTHKVIGPYGEKGTLSFTYRFLKEQVTIPILPDTTLQPFIMYIPVSHQSFGSGDPVHGTSGYMAVHSGANVGPSNGLVPISIPPTYQPHVYQQVTQPQQQPQLQPQKFHSSLPLPEKKPQSPPSQKPTHLHEHTQGARPNIKPQGSGSAALGLGAAFMGRVIGGAIIHEMISDEVGLDGFGSL
ncbi:Protein SRC2 [Cardamine amara subsp. amara]|uniref:Protein SRC2 n=1 Tax=Cardamine amara subsp. amara TaxID=228776 RepID=A0ABD1BTU7_CARAN